jgi:hypothetical protein
MEEGGLTEKSQLSSATPSVEIKCAPRDLLNKD